MRGYRPGLQPIADGKLAYSPPQRKGLMLLFSCSSHKNDTNTFSSSIAVIFMLAWLFKYRSCEIWTNWILKDGRQEGTQPVVPCCRLAIDGNLYHDFFLSTAGNDYCRRSRHRRYAYCVPAHTRTYEYCTVRFLPYVPVLPSRAVRSTVDTVRCGNNS
jgi:hypothetical protein